MSSEARAVAIVLIGDELLDARIQDGNGHWLIEQLRGFGYRVSGLQIVPDEIDRIIHSFEIAAADAALVIVSGGLGPTVDDLTREALAGWVGEELVEDADALESIRLRFECRGKAMPKGNERQAMRPLNAQFLDNPVGTAPGVWQRHGQSCFALLPGVPVELRQMFFEQVRPRMKELQLEMALPSIRLRTLGDGESAIAERVHRVMDPKADIRSSFCVHAGGVDVLLESVDSDALEGALSDTDPALFANAGESMAEVFSRINGVQAPSVDISYTDVWTDPATGIPEVGFDYSYRDLDPTVTPPVDPGCADNWTALCRITINYAEHIHPIWAVDRQVFDENDDTLLVRDDTCTVCHNVVDAMGVQMVPAAQLDLSDGPSADEPDHLKSYRELLFNDNRQVVDENGIVIDELVQATDGNGNPLFLLDAEGELVLDIDGNPIPILVNIGVQPSLNVGGANFSPAFFNRFTVSGSHDGRLSAAELKLISEWIDIGGQYYNNPFDVPQ